MTDPAADGLRAYLVEHYRPGLSVTGLATLAALVRGAAGALESEGRPVRYLHSTIVPADEALLSVFESTTVELVQEVYARADVPFDRLGLVISEGGPQWIAVEGSELVEGGRPAQSRGVPFEGGGNDDS